MLKLIKIEVPETLEQAYTLVREPGRFALAGGTMSMLQAGESVIGVELCRLLKDTVEADETRVRIGAMCTLRTLESSALLQTGALSVLPAAVRHLQGPALRNLATVGGAVGAKYPYSELLTVLLALNADVTLYRHGTLSLREYLGEKQETDIICEISFLRNAEETGLCSVRNSYVDQPLLCAAVCRQNGHWHIAVGARPFLAESLTVEEDTLTAAQVEKCAAQFRMGTDLKASAEYRRQICPTVIQRALEGENVCR